MPIQSTECLCVQYVALVRPRSRSALVSGYAQLQPGRDDYVVVATQHKGDHRSMTRALQSQSQYIALVASRKRARLVLDYLSKEGFSAGELKRVRAPSGIDLGARTPEEIALCVISEVVLVRRGGSGCLMRDTLHESPPEEAGAASTTITGASCAG